MNILGACVPPIRDLVGIIWLYQKSRGHDCAPHRSMIGGFLNIKHLPTRWDNSLRLGDSIKQDVMAPCVGMVDSVLPYLFQPLLTHFLSKQRLLYDFFRPLYLLNDGWWEGRLIGRNHQGSRFDQGIERLTKGTSGLPRRFVLRPLRRIPASIHNLHKA